MWCNIRDYTKGCEACQRAKPRKGPQLGKLSPLLILKGPWKEMTWDLIGPLPESSRYNAIVVCIDPCSKEGKFQAATTDVSGLGAAHIMRDRVIRD
jgi:hypothetical protein